MKKGVKKSVIKPLKDLECHDKSRATKNDHHYVPQVYLKRFSFDNHGNLYTYKVNPFKQYNMVRSQNKSAICYKKDLYKFRNQFNIGFIDYNKPNIIEESCFQYENDTLSKLFDQLEFSKFLYTSQLDNFLKILISIKNRNPFVMNLSKKVDYQASVNRTIDQLIPSINGSNIPQDIKDNIIPGLYQVMNAVMAEENFENDLYRRFLLDKERNHEKKIPILDLFRKSRIDILRTTVDCPFITSDNPGFTVDLNNNVYNLDLYHVTQFFFPLSPFTMLHIDLTLKEDDSMIKRHFTIRNVSSKEVLWLNTCTIQNCNEMIVSNSEDNLNILKQFIS